MSHAPRISIAHIASGDRWAGAEVQVCTLLLALRNEPDLRLAAILLNEGELAARLREGGIAVTVLDERRRSFPGLLAKAVGSLRALGADVIHTHRQKENIIGAMGALLLRVPSLRTVHGASEFEVAGLGRIARTLDELLARHVQKRLIAVSGDLAGKLRQRYPAERVVTVPNGIDIAAVESAAARPADLGPAPPDARHVGIAGRLDPVKRIDLFLEMAAILQRSESQRWVFHVFGEGKLRETLEQQAQALRIGNAVRFHGHRLDIDNCLAALDVLVMCSDHEGLPMIPLEAIAAGTPVVAHAVGGLCEILQDGSGGLLVHEHRPEAYAEAVARVVGLDAAALLERGRARLGQCYDAGQNATIIANLYRTLRAGEVR